MKIGIIGTGGLMIHAMAGMKPEAVILIDDCNSLSITDHSLNSTHTLTLIDRHEPFINFEADKFRGKNKSKRKYPRPK